MSTPLEQPTGLEDVARSVRGLARSTRTLAESATKVAERELAMAISVAARLRDEVVAHNTLETARAEEIPARFRKDVHQLVDLVADAGALLFHTTIQFLERFADERRPPLAPDAEKALGPRIARDS